MFGWNLAKMIKHFVGYAYIAGAEFMVNNKAVLEQAVQAEGGQGVNALGAALQAELNKLGTEGALIAAFVPGLLSSLDASLANAPVGAFIDAVASKMQAHGDMLIAS